MIKESFYEVVRKYANDERRAERLWLEIERSYSETTRHYHTLQHLEHLLIELQGCRHLIKHWDACVLAIVYHDIIYDPLSKGNEANSAAFALSSISEMRVPPELVKACEQLILATAKHQVSPDLDTNLFIDADLSILGANQADYEQYAKQIRQEYSIYPDILYKPGRKKVIEHFLGMERIYKTDLFFIKYEEMAKSNLGSELSEIG